MKQSVSYLDNFRTIVYGLVALFLIVLMGSVGFMAIEKYAFIDALYMTVITVSTVGFREVFPLSDAGKLFTVVLIIFSLGSFGYVITSVTRLVVEGALRQSYKQYKVNKKIVKLEDHIIVCGYGRNGYQACIELKEHGEKFVIVDKRDNVVTRILKDPDLLYVQGDASSEDVLDAAQIRRAKALITALPSDADNIFVVLTAREMNPKLKIISRASQFRSDIKLRHAGANNVIMPDRIGGQRMAKLVTQPDVVEFVEYILLQKSKEVKLIEVECNAMSAQSADKTILEMNLRKKTGANLMGLKTPEGTYIYNPSPLLKISPRDKLFVLGTDEQIEKFMEVLTEK
ncbi:voltage-gated potassium channel [Saccharicrinis carchari]|uniref:Voltage-gated potassium channel n=1 Tax=Saccharicrinis carchari TaxID=1168039 RepID=A0A521ACM8_SACCC|nr:potassium channel protein [Saccharicrinis carchari]SMO32536.1 voltage-gated potassium channel [Saccharicrinis carchari]